jgi:sialic acid synthase SpsE
VTQIKAQVVLQNDVLESKEVKNDSLYSIKDFPEGVYHTYEDFLQKRAINVGYAIERKTIVGNKIIPKEVLTDYVFFFIEKKECKSHRFFCYLV